MDTVAFRRPEVVTEIPAAAAAEASRTLAVTATYLLSEAGRKASLLAGGDGREIQQMTVQVPATRLHLVSVDAHGVARLKLRPWYQVNGDQRLIRIDAPPTYDNPPAIEDLFKAAARNHELEHAYEAERTAARAKRRQTERGIRTQLAEAFLRDRTQRALVHPVPSTKRCFLAGEHGRLLFDVATDDGLAKDVPPEAHRRFRADLRARKERNLHERAAQLALHEEKKRYIAEWIAAHGTPEQQARQAAGVLPMEEAIEAITDQAFAAAGDRRLYARDGVDRLQMHLRQFPQCADAVVTAADLVVSGANAVKATAAQWALVQELQAAFPDASVTLRVHRLAWKRDPQSASLTVVGVLIVRKVGPFTLRREYAAPDAE